MPCDVLFVAAVVAAACDFLCAQARASMRERVCSGTQLDGTIVAVVAWCCLWLVLLLFLRLCICCWLLLWCWLRCRLLWLLLVSFFLVVGCADLLMCCDENALRCGAGCSELFLEPKSEKYSLSPFQHGKTNREDSTHMVAVSPVAHAREAGFETNCVSYKNGTKYSHCVGIHVQKLET